ncbi:hypothetical protein SLEP1_g23850 [Rubroshorea leprosula]|uniref:VASt domain-containing protein n=1 Tax=Rubroshorea leprosula TaxID=152421 RepID=A0AAV5JJP4_9ROSI|nr:hypothetical protein SLEP1_g23850 [Rubroshorea leprosula]
MKCRHFLGEVVFLGWNSHLPCPYSVTCSQVDVSFAETCGSRTGELTATYLPFLFTSPEFGLCTLSEAEISQISTAASHLRAMAVAFASPERMDIPRQVDRSPSQSSSDVAAEASNLSCSAHTPDRNDSSNSDVDAQPHLALRSEEYRQLFRLPPEELLLRDFNCAFQESILLQGHMYLFVHYICFYSNIFGFETKKIIAFNEITSVKRAKMAGIFHNAIEIFAGGRKYFFASFLSRDEAFKLINDGWEQHGNVAKATTEQQESIPECSSQEKGFVAIEEVNTIKCPIDELESTDREKIASTSSASQVTPCVESDVEQDSDLPTNTDPSSSADSCTWKPENYDAPKVPEDYTKVAEAKLPIKVEEFFTLFFSDGAVNFTEAFHKRCGDKEFRCSSWHPHDKFGHARDVSFQHPIKMYLGAKFGSCQEVQKFRIYRDSNLVIETSQEINDVPYGDYFRVEGLWDVERNSNESQEGCILRVYVNVAFSKKTIWKGKIVQSTLDECREAYATWIDMAQEFLKQKPDKEGLDLAVSSVQNDEHQMEREARTEEPTDRSSNLAALPDSMDVNQRMGNLLEGIFIDATSITGFLRELVRKSYSFLNKQSRISLVVASAFVVIFLMQVSILVLLNRPQHVHVTYPVEYMGVVGSERSAENVAWLERRVHHLKDEMFMVEARLERLQHDHAALKAQLKGLEHHRRRR